MTRIDRSYYDESGYFDADASTHLRDQDSPFQRYRVRKVLDIHAPGSSDRVVDLGCGWGTFSFALAARAREVVGVDFSERSVELCEARLAQEPRDNLRFLCADAADTGLEAGAWDLVVAADLFEHLYPDDADAVVREAFRLLRPGGRLAIWTPNQGHVLEILRRRNIILHPDPTHVDYKSMDRLRSMLHDAGFGIEKAYYAESHVPVLALLERTLQGVLPMLRRRIAMLGQKRPDAQVV